MPRLVGKIRAKLELRMKVAASLLVNGIREASVLATAARSGIEAEPVVTIPVEHAGQPGTGPLQEESGRWRLHAVGRQSARGCSLGSKANLGRACGKHGTAQQDDKE